MHTHLLNLTVKVLEQHGYLICVTLCAKEVLNPSIILPHFVNDSQVWKLLLLVTSAGEMCVTLVYFH